MHRVRLLAIVIVASLGTGLPMPAAEVSAQEEAPGGIAGWVFFETTGEGADGQVWVQAFRLPDLEEAGGACVDGYEYSVLGLRPGRYKLRFGFGCGVDRDQPPYEWFMQTSGPGCAAEIVVGAGLLTDGIQADVNRDRGPEFRCETDGDGTTSPDVGVQRPLDGTRTGSPVAVGDEVDFTPGVRAAAKPGTPWGTVVGFAVGLLVAVAGFMVWIGMRGARPTQQPPPDGV